MDDNKSVLEYISQVTEINDTCDYMKDDDLDIALGYVIKFSMKPDIPTSAVPQLIVQLESMAAIFAIKKTYYATIDKGRAGSIQANKKNVYFTVTDALSRVVDALKYRVRAGL